MWEIYSQNGLLKALKRAFAELKKHGANQKAIIFTESLSTVGFLHELLSGTYKTLAFDGSKSSDYSVIKRFEAEAEALITTDVAAEGFHLVFCSFVVNYDLPYNVLPLEQRIMRCHRQGQQNDVIVLNFLRKDNFADVRMLELINKRVLQFDGIMGMSDDVVGNFTDNTLDGIIAAFEMARHKKEIETELQATLKTHEDTNTALVREAGKRKATASKTLKSRDQSLFMDGMKIDVDAEAAVQALTDSANLEATITRLFLIDVEKGSL